MKQQHLLVAFTALVAAKARVEFSPTCSTRLEACLDTGMLNAGCKLDDFKCACNNQVAIKAEMVPCVKSVCSEDEFACWISLMTDKYCEDLDTNADAASAALHHERSFKVNRMPTPDAAFLGDGPSLSSLTAIVVPNGPTTPCSPSTPTSTETSAITAETPPYPTPSITETPPTNGTGALTPSLPVFTDAAGNVKVGGAAVGLMILGAML